MPRARALPIDVVCSIYVAIFHLPFRSSPTDYLYTKHEVPLPPTNSTWSRLKAATTLKWTARRRGLRHEKEIEWDELDAVKDGDMIEAWDRIAEWDQQCLHPLKLQELRNVGDTLADNALDHVESTESQVKLGLTDKLRSIYESAFADDASEEERTACREFWEGIDRRPPPGAGALGLDWYISRYGSDIVHGLEHWPRYPSTAQNEPDALFPIWTPQTSDNIETHDESAEQEAEAEVLRRGQDVFYRYAGPMLTVLLHFSLAGGFASPRITEVLKQTAYLVPTAGAAHKSSGKNSKSTRTSALPTVEELSKTFNVDKARADRTWSRLLETTQFVLDVVEKAGSLRPPSLAEKASPSSGCASPDSGGEGWQSAVRVRLLHTIVRRRVLKLVDKRRNDPSDVGGAVYDVEKNGVPINQEDLLGTLCAFSTAPLAMLQRIGVQPTAQERKDYIALWRHVGFYMGIEPALLRRVFGDAYTADRTLWCTILHLFSQVEILGSQSNESGSESGPRMHGPTIPVLIACAGRPPFYTPLSAHIGISRRLLGKSLADSLSLPASSPRREVLTDIAFLGMQVPILFGTFYPRRKWEKRKLELSRPLMRRLIDWSFGNKRTRFEMPSHPAAAASTNTADADRGNVETRSDSHIDVPENKEYVLQLAKEWRWLMREMIAVLVLMACVVVGLIAGVYLLFAPLVSSVFR
uniref:ER-bound oxygenase mpaB/mpaB'/Rubber oxygenase catalytic domain-containing protein n=2 Tax=Kalmanozyma brasiliensis (strain GHG001) TaxID=1365824 RepID=V5E3X5_KALBG